MKLTIEPSVFKNALKAVSPSINSNPTIPVLENVRIEFDKDILWVMGTNLNLTVRHQGKCKSKDSGMFLLPFKKINAIVSLAEYPIQISVGSKVEIKIGSEYFNFGLPVDASTFPNLNESEYELSFPVDSNFLSNLKSATKFTTKDTSGFDPLRNVCIDVNEDKVSIISTDRMAFFYFYESIKSKSEIRATMDEMFINALPLIEDGEIAISERTIKLSNESTTIIATLSEQKYFNYTPALIEHKTNCLVGREELMDSLNKVMAIKTMSTIIELSFSEGKINIKFNEPEFDNEYSNSIPCEHSVDLEKIMLGAGMLKNLIQAIPQEEKVKLTFISEKSQVYLDTEDGKNLCFIAPVVHNN